jgi:hypothetical protein
MANYQVTCIRKPNKLSPHEHITHLGGNQWFETRENVIKWVNSKLHSFYVVDSRNGKTSYVGVVNPTYGSPYVRTHADGDWNDNLLSLPQC